MTTTETETGTTDWAGLARELGPAFGENQLVAAQVAHASMVHLSSTARPSPETSSAMLVRRTLVATAVLRTVEKALDVTGGAGFFRAARLERLFRDVQACRYHPVPEKQQTRLTGRLLLGLDIDG
ncbi:MAG TPA: hypothetical protein VI456_04465 [Polyangia bacterium]